MMTAEPGGFVETSDGTLVHFIDLDLHAEALRTDVADPILLIHGLVCNWHHWSRQLGGLAHSRRVVAVDVRGGAGKTRWLRPGWSTADMAADIHSVTTHLGLRRPAVVGCSMGGTIALQYALDYPLDISRLVVLASFAGLPHEMSRTVERQRAYIRSHTLGEIAAERVGSAFTGTADADLRAWMVDMIAGGDKAGYLSLSEATFAFDVRDRLGEIAVPTTIIHGEDDAPVPVARAAELRDGIPGATLRVLAEGHFVNVQAPGKVNPLLASALRIPHDLVPRR